ncbi:MAG: hypothetical protein ACRC1T_05465 [Clostridium chrysemydis]|uniref:hypothetical protein n=1 Tax=Clostridium chrysemydis TaxID=2665504 RepID=UPI003F35D043
MNKIKEELQSYDNSELIEKLEKLRKNTIVQVKNNEIIDILIDYDELLDIWFDKIMEESDKARALESEEHLKNKFSYKEGHLRGYADGLIMATSILSRLEKKAKSKKEFLINSGF